MGGLRISSSVGHSSKQKEQAICLQAGLSKANEKLLTLEELEAALQLAIGEAEQSEKDERFWGNALLAAKFTKATCDVIIDVVAEWVPPPAQPAAKLIKSVYGQKEVLADLTVGKADASKLVGSAMSIAGDMVSGTIPVPKRLQPGVDKLKSYGVDKGIGEIEKRRQLVTDGLKGELTVTKTSRYVVNNHWDVASLAAEMEGSEKASKIFNTGKALTNYAFDLYELVDERRRQNAAGSGIASAKRTAITQLKRIQGSISKIKQQISECDIPKLQTLVRP